MSLPSDLELHDPVWLLLLLLPVLLLFLEWRRGALAWIAHPTLRSFSDTAATGRVWLRRALPGLKAAGLALLVFALARPISGRTRLPREGEGLDIALLVDVSGSMRSDDMARGLTRIEVVKQVLKRFVEGRQGDRMGIIAFARYPVTVCPFTLDVKTVSAFVDRLEPVSLQGEDGTAIGVALAQAARRLKKSTAKSRIVVLLTDGANNVDDITPEEASDLAAGLGIRVYTIMAGREEEVDVPWAVAEARSESKPLIEIARATGGRFYKAEDAATLGEIYQAIGELERSKLTGNEEERFQDLFRHFAGAGLGLLLLAGVSEHSWLRRLP